MKHLLTLSVLLVICSTLAAQGMPPAAVTMDVVKKEMVRPQITGVATVEPWRKTVLGTEIAGLVVEYPLREGQPVTAKETVVCRLKTTSLEIDKAEAEALLARAKAKAATAVETARATMEEKRALRDRAEKELSRAKDLLREQVINQAEFDQKDADAIAARFQFDRAREDFDLAQSGANPTSLALEAEVRSAEARLERVNDQLRKAVIISPVSGFVVRRMTEVGGWVGLGAPIVEITTLDPVLVRVGVHEGQIGRIAVGNTASITVDALPGRTFTGTVRFIVPEADMRSRSFPVLVEIANPKTELKAGMFARASIESSEVREAFTVPKDSVVIGPMGTVIYTHAPGKNREGEDILVSRPIPVRTGVSIDGRVVIEGEGIEAGIPVISTGNEKLMPGMQVIPMGPGGPPGGPGGPDSKTPPKEGGR